jgi:hypothetical protein
LVFNADQHFSTGRSASSLGNSTKGFIQRLRLWTLFPDENWSTSSHLALSPFWVTAIICHLHCVYLYYEKHHREHQEEEPLLYSGEKKRRERES